MNPGLWKDAVPNQIRKVAEHIASRELRRKKAFKNNIQRVRNRVLITGGAGFIGSNLAWTLLDHGHEVYVVDNFITGRRENTDPMLRQERFKFYEMDVTNPDFVDLFSGIYVDQIYHLACPTGVPNIARLPMEMLLTSSVGTHNVLEVARKHGSQILFTSSCEVYGQPEVFPQHIDYTGNVSTVGPRAPYEEGKRFSESLMVTYARKFGVDGKIVRIFNTYGPRMSLEDQRVIPQFLRSVTRNEAFTIYGNGTQTRTFLYIDDLVRGLLLVMRSGERGGVYNVGNTEAVTMYELADIVAKITGHDMGINFLPHFTEDHHRRDPDISGMKALGWVPQTDLRTGLAKMIEWITVAEERRNKALPGEAYPDPAFA